MAKRSKNEWRQERIANIVVESITSGNVQKTAEEHGISAWTLNRWRNSALDGKSPESLILTQLVKKKLDLVNADNVISARAAMNSCLSFIMRAGEQANVKSPQMLRSIAGALKIVADTVNMDKALDAKLAAKSGNSAPVVPITSARQNVG